MGDITRESLQSGNVLLYLKQQFLKNRTTENFMMFASCLRDSVVWVPHVATISAEDKEQLKKAKVDDIVKTKETIRMKPEILITDGGEKYYPMFSQQKQIPESYKEQFSFIAMQTLICLDNAHANPVLNGIILDPFTEPVILPFDLADFLKEFPSRLSSDE